MIKERMSGRGFAVGSNPQTAPHIEDSFKNAISLLDVHLANRPYLFGSAPSFADFGLAPQVYEALVDPTAGRILREKAHNVVRWCEQMTSPKATSLDSRFEEWESLKETLLPFIATEVRDFLVWSSGITVAMAAGEKEMRIDLGGGRHWWQTVAGPQKYHTKSLKELRRKYSEVTNDLPLQRVLEECRIREFLVTTGPPVQPQSKL